MDAPDMIAEWLEADGLGGYASGTVSGIRTRRYHALLLTATNPPTGRVVLVNGLEVWLVTDSGRIALSSQKYGPDVIHPDGHTRIVKFHRDPWPMWRFAAEGIEVTQEIVARRGSPQVGLRWSLVKGGGPVRLYVRPLISGRDYHALHHENSGLRFEAVTNGGVIEWRPYDGVPAIEVISNGEYQHAPNWYRNFLYTEEQRRGLDCTEDLASPGVFSFDLSSAEASLAFRAKLGSITDRETPRSSSGYASALFDTERKRRVEIPSSLDRAAESYIVRRGTGKTIVAGYPWFTDWGRDTFIALRGLCIARGELDVARDILLEWSEAVSDGMLPNRFPDGGEEPEYNSVDASLWYIIAVHDYLEAARSKQLLIPGSERDSLQQACQAIVTGYAKGTRFGIRMDSDGLLAAGVPGVQLTWMDAKVGDWVVSPRIGKPVEIQALWLNALRIVSAWSPQWRDAHQRGFDAFRRRFRRTDAATLCDVVDVGHVSGQVDSSVRPNQIFAVGGLPYPLLEGDEARAVVDAVEERLLTPMGLRSLAPGEIGYCPRYDGGVRERDSAYHQGTVWPWLIGPFVEAWLRVRGMTAEAKVEAQRRFIRPLMDHLETAGLGHVSEVIDGDAPHKPGGCPFQAWSLGELLRIQKLVETPVAKAPHVTGTTTAASKKTVRRSP